MRVQYSSNNSGGGWWLKLSHWQDLERGGWTVEWEDERFSIHYQPSESPMIREAEERDRARTGFQTWLGAEATSATREFTSIEAARREWESITGMDSREEGCPCCGSPHAFYEV